MGISRKRPVFLSADWHNLLFANYTVSPSLLGPLVPDGTQLDLWNGSCFISLVAFQFQNTRVLRMPALMNRDFDEINLRFYVKRTLANGDVRRGVVFIKEIVPSRLIAWVARTLYGENYVALNMAHEIQTDHEGPSMVSYSCGEKGPCNRFSATVPTASLVPGLKTLESYITEHYWGYSETGSKGTVEYEVEHPQWPVHQVSEYNIDFDFQSLYDARYAFLSESSPTSVFFCTGSDVTVRWGTRV
mgnify:FL=1